MKGKLLLALAIVICFTNCSKEFSAENDVIVTNPNWNATTPNATNHVIRQLLTTLQPGDIVSIYDNANNNFINFGEGFLNFPTNCFVRLNNTAVVGNVTLKIKLATQFDDMIYYNLATLTNNALLSTDGMVKIEASQGNDVLKIAPGKLVDIAFNKSTSNNYLGFAGVDNNSVTNNTTWNVNTTWGVDSIGTGATGTGLTRIKVDSLVWTNCDYFYNQPNPTNIYLKLPAAYGNVNTLCYMVFRTDKVIAGMYADAPNLQFFQGANYKVPIGKNVRLVALSKVNNKLYYGAVDVTITANQTITINALDEVTETELQTRLNAL